MRRQPWVFARTLIPARTLRGRGRRLTRLGSRPLGQVLFADPKVRRDPVEIARIVAGQRMHQRAFAGFAEPPARFGDAVRYSGSTVATHCWCARFSYPLCRYLRLLSTGLDSSMNIEHFEDRLREYGMLMRLHRPSVFICCCGQPCGRCGWRATANRRAAPCSFSCWAWC